MNISKVSVYPAPKDFSMITMHIPGMQKPLSPFRFNYNGRPAGEPVSTINHNYYTQSFGFFCKKELQLEKLTKVPFRFRLGSLDYCNYLEAK